MTDDRQSLFHTSVTVFDNNDHSDCEIQYNDLPAGRQSANNMKAY